MLILTRKLGESINIGENIKVSVLGIHGRQVRIGVDAPMDVVVHREEIYVKIQEENRKASNNIPKDIKGMVNMLKDKIKGKNETKVPPTILYKDGKNGKGKGNNQSRNKGKDNSV